MDKEPRIYRVPELPGPVAIDGDWDKPLWREIRPLALDLYMGQKPAHRPRVLARLGWDDRAITAIFRVEDRYVRAVAASHQDPVCRDSCVEFFFTPGVRLGFSYFNIEINCGGTMLFCWHPAGGKAVPVAAEDLETIEIGHSLPKIVDPEIEEPTIWTVECRLSFDLLKKYCPGAEWPAPGVSWRANLYKCADATSHPHWLTWSYVAFPTPRFHLPRCFGTLRFEQGCRRIHA
jgi:hypothetical protein